MKNNQIKTLTYVLDGLMRRYSERVPDVNKVTDAMITEEIISDRCDIENDHIAFRTMGVPQLGIQSFEKIFLHLGYEKRDFFNFEGKKLNAYWFSPPETNGRRSAGRHSAGRHSAGRHSAFPRIFVSELRVDDLTENAQRIIRSYTNEVKSDPADSLDLNDSVAVDKFLHQPLWRTPTWEDYEALQQESEYAAWVIYNRYYLNHYTISVHNLKNGYGTIQAFNTFLEGIGVKLNNAGGKIKISPDGGLLQSSTVAEMIDAEFADGVVRSIAGSYIEFAERKVLPQFSGITIDKIERIHRRDGFETGNADKIFESTFTSQTMNSEM
jgi:hypothetical protein